MARVKKTGSEKTAASSVSTSAVDAGKTAAAAEVKAAEEAKTEKTAPAAKKTTSRKTAKTTKTTKTTKAEAAKAVVETKAAEKEQKANIDIPIPMFIQFMGKSVDAKTLVQNAKDAWLGRGNKEADFKSIELYINTDESMVYPVINGEPQDGFFM